MPGVPPNAIDMLKRLGRSIFSRKKKDRRTHEDINSTAPQGISTSHQTPAASAAPVGAVAPVTPVVPAVEQSEATIQAPPAPDSHNTTTVQQSSSDDTQPAHAELPAELVTKRSEQQLEDPVPTSSTKEDPSEPLEASQQSSPPAADQKPAPVPEVHAPVVLNAEPEQASIDSSSRAAAAADPTPVAASVANAAPVPVSQQ